MSLEQIGASLNGSGAAGFKGRNRGEVYGWVNRTLRQQRFDELKRNERGSVRIDTVHQGGQDGVKGVYHINAVDKVTQWEVVAAVEQISGEIASLPAPGSFFNEKMLSTPR
jgi:hypothetical protein